MIRSSEKGFTLIEIVIVIVVLAILGGFTFRFIDHATTSYTTGSRQTRLFQEATYIMERMTQELKDAYNVSYPGGSSVWFYKTNTSGQKDANKMVWYYQSSGYLYRWSPWTARLITDKVSSFNVSPSADPCDSNNPDCIITIDLELEDKSISIGSESVKVSINTKVAPKNFESGVGGRSYNGYYYDTVE
jgi:prepilin-type N-terminal cleavage/methylation domain-containing protein